MLQHHSQHHHHSTTSNVVDHSVVTVTSPSSTTASSGKSRRKPLELLTGIFCKKAKNHHDDDDDQVLSSEGDEDDHDGDAGSEIDDEPYYPEPREALHSPYHARTIDQDMEALRLSRQDNPYLQILASHEYLNEDSEYEDKHFLMSKENMSSSASNSSSRDPLTMAEVHARLVRSPPPIMWTRNTRSTADFFQFPPAVNNALLSPRAKSAGGGGGIGVVGGGSHYDDVAGKLNLSPGEGFLRRSVK